MKKYAVTENGVIVKVINSDADPVPSNYIDMTTNEPHHITAEEAQASYDLFKTTDYFPGITNKDELNNLKIVLEKADLVKFAKLSFNNEIAIEDRILVEKVVKNTQKII